MGQAAAVWDSCRVKEPGFIVAISSTMKPWSYSNITTLITLILEIV